MNAVWQHEQNGLIKVAEGITLFHLKKSQEHLENVKDTIKNKAQEMHERNWKERKVHDHLKSKVNQDENIDHTQTNKWMNYPSVTFHEEGFLMAIQEQEITTRAVRKAREKDPQKKAVLSPVCRLCHQKEENIFHIVCSCTELSSSMYLPIRHDPIAKGIYHEILEVIELGRKRQHGEPLPIKKSGYYDIWWDKVIPTSYKLSHNRPDILLYTNVTARTSYKKEIYMELIEELRVLYPRYKYKIIPVVVGALGAIPKSLKQSLTELFKNYSGFFEHCT